jgi:pyruvate dehydrogenase E2 component (dihydrolipoamide acetyltransferase)
VPVIELLVKAGDTVKADQGLVTLESDKATMEVPAPFAGVVKELRVKVGDKLAEGSVVALIEAAGAEAAAPAAKPPAAPPRRRHQLQPSSGTRAQRYRRDCAATGIRTRPANPSRRPSRRRRR